MYLGMSRRHPAEFRLAKPERSSTYALRHIYCHLEVLLNSANCLQQEKQTVIERVTGVNFKKLHIGKFYLVSILKSLRGVLVPIKEKCINGQFFSERKQVVQTICFLHILAWPSWALPAVLTGWGILLSAARIIPCKNSDSNWKGNKDSKVVFTWIFGGGWCSMWFFLLFFKPCSYF